MNTLNYIFIFVLSILFLQCINEKETYVNKIEKQTYYIDNTLDTIIICENGTKLFIPNSVFDCDSMSSSKLKIEVIELYDLKEILSQNITTLSQNQLLETFGMVKINVLLDEVKVNLSENKSMIVSFHNKYKSDHVDLFYGDSINNQINWTLESKCQDYPKNVYLNYVNSVRSNYIEFKGLGDFLMVDDVNFINHFVCNFNFNEEDKSKTNFTSFSFSISNSNRIQEVIIDQYEDKDKDKDFKNRLIRFIKDLENYTLDCIDCNIINGSTPIFGIIYFNRDENDENTQYFQFKTNRLGWLNADKYIQFQDTIDIDLDMVYSPDVKCKIVLKDPRCVIQAVKGDDNKFIFKNLPKNKKALLYVEKIKGKKVYYYVDTLNTNIEEIGSFKLQRFSKEEYNKDMEMVRDFWDTIR